MDADDHPIETILAEGRRFMVPLYQRKYQWGDERLVPFWEDVEAKAVEVLEDESKFQHYMGALILAPIGEASQIGITPRVQVVDGQQRLTTFQLFLAALREVARSHGCTEIIAHVHDYLFNAPKSKDTDPLTKFKLTPTPSDRKVFHDILEMDYSKVRSKYSEFYWGKTVPKNTALKALRAYELFKQRLEQFILFGPGEEIELKSLFVAGKPNKETIARSLEACLKAVLGRMKLVVITLGDGDDAQVIFETLNSKGEPLLAMDLVRNNIFYRAEKEGALADELYKELWDPFDEAWWREAAPNARPKRPRLDHFLAHVLAASTGEKISMRELYAEYKMFAVPRGKPRFSNVEDELRLLERHSPVYQTLEGRCNTDETLRWLGRKLSTWQVTTAYPIALQLAGSEVPSAERNKIATLLYSYIVRRAISGLTAKNLNRVFQNLSSWFIENGVSVESFDGFFRKNAGDSARFPDDTEFTNGMLTERAYYLAPGARIKDVLWELELASRTTFAEAVAMPKGLQVEHVLPISWYEHWPLPELEGFEVTSNGPHAIERNKLIHTLGNLTLITGGLNSSSSNKGFEEKKTKFSEHTGLFLNRWFLKCEDWDEACILERSRALANKAVKVWPCPES